LGDRYLIQGYIDVFTSVEMDFRFYQPRYRSVVDHIEDLVGMAYDDERLPAAIGRYFNVDEYND